MQAYAELERRFRRLANLQDAAGFLHWDRDTMMPEGGAETRAEQLATMSVLCHDMLTDPALADRLDAAETQPGLDPWQAANLGEMRRVWRHATAIESGLVEALSLACSACEMKWREARPAADFAAVRPALEEVLARVREAGSAKAEAFGVSIYDALLSEYEPGGRSADIDPLFDDLAAFLPDFIDDVLAHQKAGPAIVAPEGPFDVADQRRLGLKLMEAMGFDFRHGRLDVSLHPFSGGTPDDARITTRYDEADFTRGLMGVLHETGHALYEQNLPSEWRLQPVGQARGMALHESQSLIMEMQACRSREFLGYAAPLMTEAFGGVGPAWQVDNLARLYTRVERGFIRVDADEVTYPAHVILRYRLERAMLTGDLKLADLPGAWNDGMGELLGVTPPDDRLGCLQDIHWYDGAWAYFPTYTLGAVAAAQLFDAARRAVPDLMPGLARGDFAPLLAWLRENVHGQASSRSGEQILLAATGSALDPELFKTHLKTRYLS